MLHRRDLFHAGTTLAVVAALPACRKPGDHPAPSTSIPQPPLEPLPAPELEEASIADLAQRMASGSDTAASLVAKYRMRIAAVDQQGPMLRTVLELDPDADTTAKQLDAERAAGKLRGPLHGIPLLVKDNIDTAGKLTTTAGSLALEGTFAAKDAVCVAKLRAAGAIILGKANLSEWANFRGASSTSGWSARGGQCRNPYALDRSPSGSSSGSAAATAASLCAAALGSETDGSITSPASCNALVGVKPTIGLVSRGGVIPVAVSQDTVGPLARTVADAAVLLTAIADNTDDPFPAAALPNRPATVDYMKALDVNALRGARIGVPRKNFFGTNRTVDALMTTALAKLVELGAVLVDPADLKASPELAPAEAEVFFAELKTFMDAYLGARSAATRVHSLADLVAFNKQHADREMHFFGQENFDQALTKVEGIAAQSYLDARAKCVAMSRGLIDSVMAEHNIDAFVAATSGPAWLIDPVNGDAAGGANAYMLPAIAGYPHVSVPGGAYLGLPIGLSFFGAPYTEAKLLGYAFAYEQATKHRKPPRFLATVELV